MNCINPMPLLNYLCFEFLEGVGLGLYLALLKILNIESGKCPSCCTGSLDLLLNG